MMNRRIFLARFLGSVIWAEATLIGFQKSVLAAALKREESFFSHAESLSLRSYVNTLIPETKLGPSGCDAGVVAYLVKLFSDELPRWRRARFIPNGKPRQYVAIYKQLLKRLDQLAEHQYAKRFVELAATERIHLIDVLSGGSGQQQVGYAIKSQDLNAQLSDVELFKLSRTHCLQGYLADPKYGGNRNYAAWDSIKHICHFNYQKSNPSCDKHDH